MAQELAVVEKKPSGQLAKLKKKKKKQQLTPLDRFGKPIKKPTFNKQELQEAVRRLAPSYNEMPRVPHEFGRLMRERRRVDDDEGRRDSKGVPLT